MVNSFGSLRKVISTPNLGLFRYLATNAATSKESERDCWSCLKRISCKTYVCQCGKIQGLSPNLTYFDYFNFDKPTMKVDLKDLSRQKRKLQLSYHPDKFTRASKAEQEIANSVSAKVNDAFKVLSDPLSRAEYILTLRGSPCSSQDVAISDLAFLADVMELNEEVDKLTDDSDAGDDLDRRLVTVYDAVMTRWRREFEALSVALENDEETAQEFLSRLRYFERLRKRLKEMIPEFKRRGIAIPDSLEVDR